MQRTPPEHGGLTGLPFDTASGYVGSNEATEAQAKYNARYWQAEGETFRRGDDTRFSSDPEAGMRYFAQSPVHTAICGLFGVLLFFGQFALPTLDDLAGSVLGRSVGLVRLGMILAGALFILLAWPRYRGSETDAEAAELEDAKERFARRMWNKR
jgi:hypothetical protein